MTKHEIIRAIAQRENIPVSEVETILDAFLSLIALALATGDGVKLVNFGKFEAREQKPITRRNPRTGEAVYVGAKTAVRFRAAPALRARVSGASYESDDDVEEIAEAAQDSD